MTNNIINQATALIMGSLVVFSGQALAFSANNQEFARADPLNQSELIVANENEALSLSFAVAVAVQALDRSIVRVRTVAIRREIPPEVADLVLAKLQDAQISMAKAESSAEQGDNFAVAVAIAQAISFMSEGARALATADAGSAQALAEAIAEADFARAVAAGQTSASTRKAQTYSSYQFFEQNRRASYDSTVGESLVSGGFSLAG